MAGPGRTCRWLDPCPSMSAAARRCSYFCDRKCGRRRGREQDTGTNGGLRAASRNWDTPRRLLLMDIGNGSRKAECASVAAACHASRSHLNVAAHALVQSPPSVGHSSSPHTTSISQRKLLPDSVQKPCSIGRRICVLLETWDKHDQLTMGGRFPIRAVSGLLAHAPMLVLPPTVPERSLGDHPEGRARRIRACPAA